MARIRPDFNDLQIPGRLPERPPEACFQGVRGTALAAGGKPIHAVKPHGSRLKRPLPR